MQYTAELTLPKGKNRQTQTSTKLKAVHGVIHRIDIVFPSGCAALVNVQIFVGGHPIAPSTEGQTYKGDNEVISFPEFEELRAALNTITISGWNEDEVYDHTILVRIYVLPRWALLPIGAVEGMVRSLKSLFER